MAQHSNSRASGFSAPTSSLVTMKSTRGISPRRSSLTYCSLAVIFVPMPTVSPAAFSADSASFAPGMGRMASSSVDQYVSAIRGAWAIGWLMRSSSS